MKKFVINLLSLVLTLVFFSGYAQEECKVLVPELVGVYEGKCKKGLASGKGIAEGIDKYEGQFLKGLPDGKGTYYWQNGDVYEGDWFLGKREGVGTFTFSVNGHDSIVSGLWKQDEYQGPVPPPPHVLSMTGVDRYTFVKIGNSRDLVLINFYQNGSINKGIEGLNMSTSSGINTQSGTAVGFDYIIFPVTIKLNYTTFNKLHTVKYYVQFEFTISEPGEWDVSIHN
jgi:hypothetical protein